MTNGYFLFIVAVVDVDKDFQQNHQSLYMSDKNLNYFDVTGVQFDFFA